MARMFPEKLPQRVIDDRGRGAERRVYDAFRDAVSNAYTVFYSVSWLRRPIRGRRAPKDGEADFIVAHATRGIVTIEVKGGQIARDGQTGQWTQSGRVLELSPIEQALRSKYALLEKLKEIPGWGNRWIEIGHAAIFPGTASPGHPLGPDAPKEIVGFESDLASLEAWLERVSNYWQEGAVRAELGREGIHLLERILAPSFELRAPLGPALREEDRQILELTEEQFDILQLLSRVNRVAVCGGAGTGKTLLALEKAKRLSQEGFATLLTCFNRPLAEHLRHSAPRDENLRIANFHELCWDLAREARVPLADLFSGSRSREYFDQEMPAALMQALEQTPQRRFDAILVDEGQDFRPDWWVPLQLSLTDPDDGLLYVFYDENQRVYGEAVSLPEGLIPIPLTKNLRNTREIHKLARRFYEGQPVVAAGPQGRPVEFVLADNARAVAKEVGKLLERFIRQEQIAPEDIAVLTGHAFAKSQLVRNGRIGSVACTQDQDANPGRVLLDSIWRFKGLERPVVILAEIGTALGSVELLYVGLSRARVHLAVVGNRQVEQAVIGTGELGETA